MDSEETFLFLLVAAVLIFGLTGRDSSIGGLERALGGVVGTSGTVHEISVASADGPGPTREVSAFP